VEAEGYPYFAQAGNDRETQGRYRTSLCLLASAPVMPWRINRTGAPGSPRKRIALTGVGFDSSVLLILACVRFKFYSLRRGAGYRFAGLIC